MRSFIFILLLLVVGISAHGQTDFKIGDDVSYAIIKDTDGYVNVRKAPGNTAPIIGKIKRNSIFSCETNSTNWWKVLQDYENDKSNWLEGYIYKDRVSLLPTHWESVSKKYIYADSCKLKTDGTVIVVKAANFNPKKHRLLYQSNNLEGIDGRRFWGTDGAIPKVSVASIKIWKNNKSVLIPKDAYNDLYEPRLETLSFTKASKDTFYLMMTNSDGAGAYTVIWTYRDNKYVNRYIDYSWE